MKKFFTFATLSLLSLISVVEAAPKRLAVQDIDFDTVQNGQSNTVRSKIYFQRDQFQSIANKNLRIEVRFYSGQQANNQRRIMKDREYFLPSVVSSFDMNSAEACPAPGKYFAKVWLSVRNEDRSNSPNENYETYQEVYPYVCEDHSRSQKLQVNSVDFKPAVPVSRTTYRDLNLVIDMNNNQYNSIERGNDKVEVRLYAYRDGHTYRVGKGKRYTMNSAKASFGFKVKEFCGEASNWIEDLFGKEVEAGCRLSVINEDGSRNPRYAEFACPTERFICY